MWCLSKVTVLIFLLTITQAAFIFTPTSVNATLGSTATFTCRITTGLLHWIINGSTLPELNTTDITATITVGTSTLHIPATEQYNNTNVTCSVAIRGIGFLDSDPVVLRVQGVLAAVESLEAYPQPWQTFILLTWTPPFSLDLTGINPDVLYYVEVYNISTGGKTLFINSYKVFESQFNFTLPSPSPCDQFEFRVIPANGAGNGSMASVNGTFSEIPVHVYATILVDVLSETEMDVEIYFSQTPDICKSRLVATNQKTGEVSEVLFPKHEGSSLSVKVTNGTGGILFNYHYNITLELMNGAGKIDINKNLSLFDVQESTANKCSFPGAVNASCVFANNSQALGCLVILHPQNTTQTEMFAYAAKGNSAELIAEISISGVPKGSHTVLVFDGEQNGLLSTRAAAMQNVIVTQGGPEPAMSMDSGASASIQEADSNICVTCSDINDGESNGCVVVVHSTQNLESIASHEIPKSSERCYPQEDGEYTVAVFRQSMSNVLQENPLNVSVVSIYGPNPTTSSPVPSVTAPTTPVDPVPVAVGASVASLMIAAALVIIIIAAVIIKRRSYVTYDIGSSEKLSLQSYQRAKKGKNKPLRVAPDCGDTEQTSGLIYADVNAVTGKIKPPTLDERVQYSDILPPAMVTTPRVEPTPPPLPAKSHTSNKLLPRQQSSISLDILFSELYSVIPKWKQLVEVIGIDEDLVDEIFTNNEGDEECLRAVLEVWMKKSPTWTTVTDSLNKIGEDQLAGSLYLKCVLPGMVESPSKPHLVEPPPCDTTPPPVEPLPPPVQHSPVEEEETHIMDAREDSENDGGVEQEQGEERIPPTSCKRHAVDGLYPQVQNAKESREKSVLIPLHSHQEEKHNFIEDESRGLAPHTETVPGTFCVSSHLLWIRRIQKQQLCKKDTYLTPAQSTVQTSIVPVRMLDPIGYGNSDNKDCSEANEQQNVYLYMSPIQCASKNDAATTSECVGPEKIRSADAVQDTNEKAGQRSEVLEMTIAKEVQAEFEDETTTTRDEMKKKESMKSKIFPLSWCSRTLALCLELPCRPSHDCFENFQRYRTTEMILTSHAVSLGVCCQILRHYLRGMQPLCSGSSSEDATVEERKELMELDFKITFQRVVTQQLRTRTKYNCPFTLNNNYAYEVVIHNTTLLVKSLPIRNFLHSTRDLEKHNGMEHGISDQHKQAVWASYIPQLNQIIFYLKSKWFQFFRRGYNCLLKIKAHTLKVLETTLKMQPQCKI